VADVASSGTSGNQWENIHETQSEIIATVKRGNGAAAAKRRDWFRDLGAPILTSDRVPWLLRLADSLAFRVTIFCQSIGAPVHLVEIQPLADGLRYLRLLGSTE